MGDKKPEIKQVPSSTTTKQILSPQQNELLNAAQPALLKAAKDGFQLPTESGIAPRSAATLQGEQSALTAAGNLEGTISSTQDLFNFLSKDILDPASNPGLQGQIDSGSRRLLQNLTESILPGIRGESVTNNTFGSSRQGIAEGRAIEGTQLGISDLVANLLSENFKAALPVAGQALQFSPQLADLTLKPAQIQATVGAQRDAFAQAQKDEEVFRFMAEQTMPFTIAQSIAQTAAGIPGGTVSSNSSTPFFMPGQPGLLSKGLGLAGQAASIAGAFI